MLVRFFPHQVAEHWDVIKVGIEESLPPIISQDEDKMNKVLESLLLGNLQCWISYATEELGSSVDGMVCTRILYDDVSDTRNLLVYCAYAFDKTIKDTWISGLATLNEYGLKMNCSQLIGYTSVASVINIAKRLDWDTSFTFISIPIQLS